MDVHSWVPFLPLLEEEWNTEEKKRLHIPYSLLSSRFIVSPVGNLSLALQGYIPEVFLLIFTFSLQSFEITLAV